MFLIIFFKILSAFLASVVWAVSPVEISGELAISATAWNLPTGERGNSAFAAPVVFLDFQNPLQEGNLLFVNLEGSEEKDYAGERFGVKVREAYVDLVSPFNGLQGLRLGLMPNLWHEAQYHQPGHYRFITRDAWSLTEKWKYSNFSDLGLSYVTEVWQGAGEVAVTLVNGEGAQEKEAGPHKEASVFLRWNGWESISLRLNLVYGGYDNYEKDIAGKERYQALLSYRGTHWGAGLEYLGTRDPANAVRDYNMAEGVDVVSLLGQSVAGQAGSAYVVLKTGPKAELMLRYDYLDSVVEEEGKNLQTAMASLTYQLTADIRSAVLLDYTWYSENYSAAARDRSKVTFATQVLF